MANGVIIIDKPQDWTSMDVCAPQMQASAGTPEILSSSAEVNSACGKVLPLAKRLYGAKAPELGTREAWYG